MDSTLAITRTREIYRKYDSRRPMDYFILKKVLNDQYLGESNLAELFSYLAILCIFIALLGLLGLSSFVASQRTHEIGIRKVMGAGPRDILTLLNREFVYLVAIAFFISVPLAWFFSHLWLKGFACHIQVTVLPFIISGAFSMLITLLTTNIYTLKAVGKDPVLSLKCDC